MKIRTVVMPTSLVVFFLASTVFFQVAYAVEERKVLTRNYVGFGVEVYAPYQCYSGENVSVRIRLEALEDVKNVSVTLFVWGSKSEGYGPWGTSVTVLDVEDFAMGTVQDDEYDVEIPSDIDLGLTYGILSLDWSVYIPPSWEDQWDKASFRGSYVKNRDSEDLQTMYESVKIDLQNARMLMYAFLATTILTVASTIYFAKNKA